jgi:hypothetical protein
MKGTEGTSQCSDPGFPLTLMKVARKGGDPGDQRTIIERLL